MGKRRAWVVCVRVNRHDKAYFLHQIDGFSRVDPFLVVWEDMRPEIERRETSKTSAVLHTPWERQWQFPGGHRLLNIFRKLRGRLVRDPLAANAGELTALRILAKQHPPDVLYAHTGFVGLRLLPLKEALGIPLVVHFHGLDVTTTDPFYRSALLRGLPQFDHVIVVSQWMVERLVDMGCSPDIISVVPMGAPTTKLPEPAATTSAVVRFIAVGRLVGVKGLDRTIDAFAQAHRTYPQAELHLVGDGPLRTILEAQVASLSLESVVVFHGQIPAAQTLIEIAQADVLVHHALDHPGGPEAFGVVITEAMALARPVVGTRCGGLPDQIVDGETGFLVDQNDTGAMADAMAHLAADADLRARMGAAGRDRACALFDAHVLAGRAEDILIRTAAG